MLEGRRGVIGECSRAACAACDCTVCTVLVENRVDFCSARIKAQVSYLWRSQLVLHYCSVKHVYCMSVIVGRQ